ncbi:hypothetical protein, partial [Helicobacter sp.]|uniref:hypothetical protein n=1 Tax=Helicobacter sp. TaxID=218 RepID=UPI0019A104A7
MGKFTPRDNIIIQSFSVKGGLIECKIKVSEGIRRYFTSDSFFIEYDEDLSGIPESLLICPFIASLLALAWITDSVIWVNEIDRTFYESLSRIREAYQDIYYFTTLKGRVVPSIYIDNYLSINESKNKSIILFSGGADCHASLIRNLDKTPILCNIQGWYKSKEDVDKVAEADKKDIGNFAKQFSLPFSFVRSNFATIINQKAFDKDYKSKLGDSLWHGFLHSMAFISIAIPLAYKHSISEIIIASSLTTGLNFLCASNSTTDSEFRYALEGRCSHDGFELHRQNKIKVITDFQRKLNRPYFMRVCSFNDSNCCECEKCFRTVLGIVAENSNPEDFGFNIDKSLKDHWQDVMNKRIALMGFSSEKSLHWPHIIKRMKANYKDMSKEKQEFVDWFLSYDFQGEKKKAVKKYYRDNFFEIVKRKLKS